MNEILITINGVTKSLNQNADFVLEHAENMRWGKLDLATKTNPYVEGDFIQNARGLARDITLTLRFLNTVSGAEAAKDWFYTSFNKQVTLTWVGMGENNSNWTIQGFVDEIDEDTKTNSSTLTVNIHCSNPYWKGSEIIEYATGSNLTLETVFKGNVPTGFSIAFTAEISKTSSLSWSNIWIRFYEFDQNINSFREYNVVNLYSEEILENSLSGRFQFNTERGHRHLMFDNDEYYNEFVHGPFFYVNSNVTYKVELAVRREGSSDISLIPFTIVYSPRWL